jgi:hypothetical protein
MLNPRKKHSIHPIPKKPITALCLIIALGAGIQVHQLSKIVQNQPNRSRRNQIEENLRDRIPTKQIPDGISPRPKASKTNIVKADDVVVREGWDSSPIVVESHKLVFFTVPKAG